MASEIRGPWGVENRVTSSRLGKQTALGVYSTLNGAMTSGVTIRQTPTGLQVKGTTSSLSLARNAIAPAVPNSRLYGLVAAGSSYPCVARLDGSLTHIPLTSSDNVRVLNGAGTELSASVGVSGLVQAYGTSVYFPASKVTIVLGTYTETIPFADGDEYWEEVYTYWDGTVAFKFTSMFQPSDLVIPGALVARESGLSTYRLQAHPSLPSGFDDHGYDLTYTMIPLEVYGDPDDEIWAVSFYYPWGATDNIRYVPAGGTGYVSLAGGVETSTTMDGETYVYHEPTYRVPVSLPNASCLVGRFAKVGYPTVVAAATENAVSITASYPLLAGVFGGATPTLSLAVDILSTAPSVDTSAYAAQGYTEFVSIRTVAVTTGDFRTTSGVVGYRARHSITGEYIAVITAPHVNTYLQVGSTGLTIATLWAVQAGSEYIRLLPASIEYSSAYAISEIVAGTYSAGGYTNRASRFERITSTGGGSPSGNIYTTASSMTYLLPVWASSPRVHGWVYHRTEDTDEATDYAETVDGVNHMHSSSVRAGTASQSNYAVRVELQAGGGWALSYDVVTRSPHTRSVSASVDSWAGGYDGARTLSDSGVSVTRRIFGMRIADWGFEEVSAATAYATPVSATVDYYANLPKGMSYFHRSGGVPVATALPILTDTDLTSSYYPTGNAVGTLYNTAVRKHWVYLGDTAIISGFAPDQTQVPAVVPPNLPFLTGDLIAADTPISREEPGSGHTNIIGVSLYVPKAYVALLGGTTSRMEASDSYSSGGATASYTSAEAIEYVSVSETVPVRGLPALPSQLAGTRSSYDPARLMLVVYPKINSGGSVSVTALTCVYKKEQASPYGIYAKCAAVVRAVDLQNVAALAAAITALRIASIDSASSLHMTVRAEANTWSQNAHTVNGVFNWTTGTAGLSTILGSVPSLFDYEFTYHGDTALLPVAYQVAGFQIYYLMPAEW